MIAFVVPKPDEVVSEQELDRLCLDNIARFKRPKGYRFVGPLPKNNYGKVLKTELRRVLAEEQGMMRKVLVGGIGSTTFGRHGDIAIQSLAIRAADAAIREPGIDRREIGALYLGNFVSGV